MTDSPPVACRHTDAGTPESAWLGSNRWDRVPPLDVDALARRHERVLVVSAHPDDETLGVGALVATLHRNGVAIHLVVATDGERSHALPSAELRGELGRRRRRQVEVAARALAPGIEITFLGVPDGEVEQHEASLSTLVAQLAVDSTLAIAPWVHDGHPDHDATGRACADAAARTGADVAYYPIWLWHWGTPDTFPWADAVAVEHTVAAANRSGGERQGGGSQGEHCCVGDEE